MQRQTDGTGLLVGLAAGLLCLVLAACAVRPQPVPPGPSAAEQALAEEAAGLEEKKKRRARRALRRNRRLVVAFEAASIMAAAQERGVRITIAGLLFEFGSDGLRPTAKDRLSRVAGVLGREGRGRKVMVEGHSDAIGAELFNLDLSRRRAAAVAQELKRAGVAAALVSAAGYGSKYPVAPNEGSDGRDDPAGRARNRRVEILVLD